MTTISRAAYAAAIEAGSIRASAYVNRALCDAVAGDILGEAFRAAGIDVESPPEGESTKAPDATRPITISRERYEAGALAAGKASRLWRAPAFATPTDHEIADAFLAAAGIEVEPERTAEERLAELEKRHAAFVADIGPWFRCAPHGIQWAQPPHASGGMGDLILRHFPEVGRYV